MAFSERFKKACDRAGIEWSQTAIGKALGVSKQTADRWMGNGQPSADTLFGLADKLRAKGVPPPFSDPRWLATGENVAMAGVIGPDGDKYGDLSGEERALVASYRKADPRWQLSLRLLAALADPEDQIEAATDVNYVVARIVGKKPVEVRYASDRRVEEAFGQAPHVAARKAREKP